MKIIKQYQTTNSKIDLLDISDDYIFNDLNLLPNVQLTVLDMETSEKRKIYLKVYDGTGNYSNKNFNPTNLKREISVILDDIINLEHFNSNLRIVTESSDYIGPINRIYQKSLLRNFNVGLEFLYKEFFNGEVLSGIQIESNITDDIVFLLMSFGLEKGDRPGVRGSVEIDGVKYKFVFQNVAIEGFSNIINPDILINEIKNIKSTGTISLINKIKDANFVLDNNTSNPIKPSTILLEDSEDNPLLNPSVSRFF